jgi:hypothetical protein
VRAAVLLPIFIIIVADKKLLVAWFALTECFWPEQVDCYRLAQVLLTRTYSRPVSALTAWQRHYTAILQQKRCWLKVDPSYDQCRDFLQVDSLI